MGYEGGKIASLFRPEPTQVAVREMAEKGGDRMHELVVVNTPIGGREVEGGGGGNLRSSWYVTPVNRSRLPSAGDVVAYEVRVATDVDYAPDVEWGTGLWGPNHAKYEIKPKDPGGWLHWIDPKTGEDVFAKRVMHPGSPGQHMMATAAAMTEHEMSEGHLFTGILERWKHEQEALAD